jgi:hypothetical protein
MIGSLTPKTLKNLRKKIPDNERKLLNNSLQARELIGDQLVGEMKKLKINANQSK